MNRFRVVQIYIDNIHVGGIESKSSLELDLAPGKHIIQSKLDWCSSKPQRVTMGSKHQKEVFLKGPKWEKFMLLTTTFLGVLYVVLILNNSMNTWLFVAGIIPTVGYRLYYFTLGRNKYIQMTIE